MVGSNGASLANVLYCREGTQVVVLQPTALTNNTACGWSHFQDLANALGLEIWHLTMESARHEHILRVPVQQAVAYVEAILLRCI